MLASLFPAILIGILFLSLIIIVISGSQRGVGLLPILWYFFTHHPFFLIIAIIINVLFIWINVLYPWFILLSGMILLVEFAVFQAWSDDQFLDNKIGGWLTSQEFQFFELIPTLQSQISPEDMNDFFVSMHTIYGSRSQKNFRTTGKFFEEMTLEIHCTQNKLRWFVKINKTLSAVLVNAVQTYLSNVILKETADPLGHWSKSLPELEKEYSHIEFCELKFPKSDIYPLKPINEIITNNPKIKKPLSILMTTMENGDPNDYIIIQFVLRPLLGGNSNWSEELKTIRKELSSNSSVEVSSSGRISQLTKQERKILNGCEDKMNSPSFSTKPRLLMFGKSSTPKKYLAGIMSFFKMFYSERQLIIPDLKSWDESTDASWGPAWDEIYWKPENRKRKIQYIKAMHGRSLTKGLAPQYWSIQELSSVLLLPSGEDKQHNLPQYQSPNQNIKYIEQNKHSNFSSNNPTLDVDFQKLN